MWCTMVQVYSDVFVKATSLAVEKAKRVSQVAFSRAEGFGEGRWIVLERGVAVVSEFVDVFCGGGEMWWSLERVNWLAETRRGEKPFILFLQSLWHAPFFAVVLGDAGEEVRVGYLLLDTRFDGKSSLTCSLAALVLLSGSSSCALLVRWCGRRRHVSPRLAEQARLVA